MFTVKFSTSKLEAYSDIQSEHIIYTYFEK